MDTSQKDVFAGKPLVYSVPLLYSALVAEIVHRVRWQKSDFRWTRVFFAATVIMTALRRESAAHIENRGTG